MIRTAALLGLTLVSAGGIAGSIQTGPPVPLGMTLPQRLLRAGSTIAFTPAQRPAWRAVQADADTLQALATRPSPSADPQAALAAMPATLAHQLQAATTLANGLHALLAELSPGQQAQLMHAWAGR